MKKTVFSILFCMLYLLGRVGMYVLCACMVIWPAELRDYAALLGYYAVFALSHHLLLWYLLKKEWIWAKIEVWLLRYDVFAGILVGIILVPLMATNVIDSIGSWRQLLHMGLEQPLIVLALYWLFPAVRIFRKRRTAPIPINWEP